MSCILPIIEYADVVWGGSYERDLDKLNLIHHKGARIMATEKCSTTCLMEEAGWDSLLKRRRAHRLTFFFKIVNGKSPPYLQNVLPRQRGEGTSYSLRHVHNYTTISARLRHFANSFIPQTLKDWNILDESVKRESNINTFKRLIFPKRSRNQNYYFGARRENVSLARLRIGCSKLNDDLYRNLHVIDSPSCQCGNSIENAIHFFFLCPKFNAQRTVMIEAISPLTRLSLQTLLYGSPLKLNNVNIQIMEAVHTFIRNTKRFD